MNKIRIERVNYLDAITEIKNIRKQVFQEEQNVPEELEFDGLDNKSIQLLAYWKDNAVGTSRIREIDKQTIKIERLAVLKEARGNEIGRQLMETAIKIATDSNYQIAVVHAQEYIKELYSKLGFKPVGNTFYEADILHLKMRKNLSTFSSI